MGNKKKNERRVKRLVGTFTIPSGEEAFGDLLVKGERTLLSIHSESRIPSVGFGATILGTAVTGERLTLIDCQDHGGGASVDRDGSAIFNFNIFPHYLCVGRFHIDPKTASIERVEFSTQDTYRLFTDFNAFGSIHSAEPFMEVLNQLLPTKIKTGDCPIIQYFSGSNPIAKVDTIIGEITVENRPSSSSGGPEGVYIDNKVVISIHKKERMTFTEALDAIQYMRCFLSMAAGRAQTADNIRLILEQSHDDVPKAVDLYQSFSHKGTRGDLNKPDARDIPFDPVRRPDEFNQSIQNWLVRHSTWKNARIRYPGCLEKTPMYDIDRLVAAANMFDILPDTALPVAIPLPADLEATKTECLQMFRKHSWSVDRDGALSALGRLGKPSLPKKVAHRISIIEPALGAKFPGLQTVGAVAIKCRNYFVHGSTADIDHEKIAHLIPFLTDALEFIFCASDLVEAGWDANRWAANHHGFGHSFARFRVEYISASIELQEIIKPTSG